MEITLLLFGIILFNFFYFGRSSVFHVFFRKDEIIKWLFYFYSPLILAFSFIKIPDVFARLGRIAAFACTIFGIVVLEIAVYDSIRFRTIFDVCYHGFIILQLAFLTRLLLLGLRKNLDLHEKLKMDMTPDWISNIIVLIWVVAGTLLFSIIPGIKSYLVAEYTFLSGNLLLWILQWWREKRLPKEEVYSAENTYYNKSYKTK